MAKNSNNVLLYICLLLCPFLFRCSNSDFSGAAPSQDKPKKETTSGDAESPSQDGGADSADGDQDLEIDKDEAGDGADESDDGDSNDFDLEEDNFKLEQVTQTIDLDHNTVRAKLNAPGSAVPGFTIDGIKFDQATANQLCIVWGYDSAANVTPGKEYDSPKNNSIMSWDPANNNWNNLRADYQGNRKFGIISCTRKCLQYASGNVKCTNEPMIDL